MISLDIHYAFADSIDFLNPEHWDTVTAQSGLFLSRPFLRLLEQQLPINLSAHYALVYSDSRPVAAVVAQSLEIRVTDLSSGNLPETLPGFWHSLGEASQRSLSRAQKRFLLYDDLLQWPFNENTLPEFEGPGELWPDVALDLWHRLRSLLKTVEHAAELPIAWVHLRFLVCGNLLSTGPHGAAFAEGEDPAKHWPAVLEALYRIRRSSTIFGESDMMMIKDFINEQAGAKGNFKNSGFRRFEMEPTMVLQIKSCWTNFDDYLNDMKSDYRSRIRKTQQRLDDSGVVLERLDPGQVKAEAAEIFRLYHQVHDHQKLRLATIRETWIPALAEYYQDDFRTVVARPRDGGKILGFVTLIRDGDSAFGYYIGFDKATASRGVPLYISLIYAGVAQAIDMRVARFVLGRTALEPKAQIGAKAQATYGYLRHRSPALNLALSSILAILPAPEQAPDRHPFK
jgi:predicted N-acyltransferase